MIGIELTMKSFSCHQITLLLLLHGCVTKTVLTLAKLLKLWLDGQRPTGGKDLRVLF